MSPLIQSLWIPETPKTVVCIDSYQDGIFQGHFYSSDLDVQLFDSLSQFLLMMEKILEQEQRPQSYTVRRCFSELLSPVPSPLAGSLRRGTLATFELQILFRQHTSWQGVLFWREQKQQQRFRSVLELILLMDNALRYPDGKEAV